jgi:hypothetical protein
MKAFYALILLAACSSNDDACVESSIGAANVEACFGCIKTSCSSQLGTFDSACSSYLSCACPDGEFVGSAAVACGMDLGSDCVAAGAAMNACAGTTCASSCGSGG